MYNIEMMKKHNKILYNYHGYNMVYNRNHITESLIINFVYDPDYITDAECNLISSITSDFLNIENILINDILNASEVHPLNFTNNIRTLNKLLSKNIYSKREFITFLKHRTTMFSDSFNKFVKRKGFII